MDFFVLCCRGWRGYSFVVNFGSFWFWLSVVFYFVGFFVVVGSGRGVGWLVLWFGRVVWLVGREVW